MMQVDIKQRSPEHSIRDNVPPDHTMKWFKSPPLKETLLDTFNDVAPRLIVEGYRRHAKHTGGPPTHKTSDHKILETYNRVGTGFREAAKRRGELLPASNLNFIVLKFLQLSEMLGDAMVEAHLKYEIDKYVADGLCEDYKRDLQLYDEAIFDKLEEPPEWFIALPEPLQFPGPILITRLERLRKKAGVEHQQFFFAVMQSRHIIWLNLRLMYDEAKRTMPGLGTTEYLAMTIADRAVKKMLTLPINTSPTAWTQEQLQWIVDNAESLAEKLTDLKGLFYFVVEMEKREGSLADPQHLITRIDAIFSVYAETSYSGDE